MRNCPLLTLKRSDDEKAKACEGGIEQNRPDDFQ